MGMGIFGDYAERHWNAGLPAIPLLPGKKRPAINGWQRFADIMPDGGERAAWLQHFEGGNIGLPLGVQSGLVAVDIDTDDPEIMAVLDRVLPVSPWKRVGAKGSVRIYRFNGETTRRFHSKDGRSICEILSSGTQIVLPPSIHPDTKRPYVADTDLWSPEVLGAVKQLPLGFEDILLESLREAGIDVGAGKNGGVSGGVVDIVPQGHRDNKMIWHAGLLARAVTRGERTLLQALGEMTAWIEGFVQQVAGDELPVEKGWKKVCEFLVKDVTGPRKMALPDGWDEGMDDKMKEDLGLAFTSDDMRWNVVQIMEYLATELIEGENRSACDERAMNGINTVLKRVARPDSGLAPLDEERILRLIVAQGGGLLTVSALRRTLKDLRAGAIEGTNHDEIAEAVLEHMGQFGEVRFHAGGFWQWRGSHWEKLDEAEIIRVVSSDFGQYPSCRKTGDYLAIARLLRAKAACELKREAVNGVNFANGFLDETGELREHHEDLGQTYVLKYRYLPEMAEKMPMFNKFLTDSWGKDADFARKVEALQEAVGATLFGAASRFQRAICLYGQAGSGKSTMSLIVRGLLPKEAISAVPPESWDDKFLPAEMFGKLLNFAGELSEKKRIPGQQFKQIVEGESISAQFKNRDPFVFNPVCAQWFNSNHLPKTDDTSDGFNRRWLFLEWPRSVAPEKKIVDLDVIISGVEREAIVAWAVAGFFRLLKRGDYTLPASHFVLVDQMAVDNNTVRYFLQKSPRLQYAEGGKVTVNDLYNEYWSFCLAMGVTRRASAATFTKGVRDLAVGLCYEVVDELGKGGAQVVSCVGLRIMV